MTRRGWLAASGLLMGVLAGSVIDAPARWVDVALAAATGDRVRLLDPRGTVWRGEALLSVRGDRARSVLPGRVSWRLHGPAWDGSTFVAPVLTLHLECCASSPLRVRLSRQGGSWVIAADAWQTTWDMAWTSALGTPWNTLGLQGLLEVTTEPWEWSPVSGTTPMPVRWQARITDLSSAVSTVRPLGSYRIDGQSSATGTTLSIATEHGALALSGHAHWDGRRLRLDGLAQADPQQLEALSNLLNLLGRRDGPRAHLRIG